ncbi:hypothetical protein SQ11_10775 [Nitrosospira sp. NpAV]|nr:hypothetical protein SQ11_10775 [Nitrosospira sp. NpAV]
MCLGCDVFFYVDYLHRVNASSRKFNALLSDQIFLGGLHPLNDRYHSIDKAFIMPEIIIYIKQEINI